MRRYGYDDAWALAGDLFEAETNCVREHNLGQSATGGVPNLSYFSSKAITTPLLQNPTPLSSERFNASKTYMAFVIGDGDNVAFMRGSRAQWMEQRLSHCRNGSGSCFPLLWSASPQLLHLAPDWLRWFYNISYQTQHDYFVLPPSGDTYSYPSQMQPAQQAVRAMHRQTTRPARRCSAPPASAPGQRALNAILTVEFGMERACGALMHARMHAPPLPAGVRRPHGARLRADEHVELRQLGVLLLVAQGKTL